MSNQYPKKVVRHTHNDQHSYHCHHPSDDNVGDVVGVGVVGGVVLEGIEECFASGPSSSAISSIPGSLGSAVKGKT